MIRRHLFEFHELDRFPRQWRDFCTDVLSHLAGSTKVYQIVAEKLWNAVSLSKACRVLDLCSGGAVPVNTVREKWLSDSRKIPILVSDKYPNHAAFQRMEQLSNQGIQAVYSPVDAKAVPVELTGFRTIFTSFHHFDRKEAENILADAVRSNQGIGIFEYTERNFLVWVPVLLLVPLYVFCITPFLRPFRWMRLVWTYLIPVVPIVLMWDGLVSCFRTYSPSELDEMLRRLPEQRYNWQIGRSRCLWFIKVTYMIGYPAESDFANPVSPHMRPLPPSQ